MSIVNYAWESFVAQVETNKVAIAKRGWFPMNRNLLLNAQLRSTMTNGGQTDDADTSVILPYHAARIFLKTMTLH